MRTSDANGEDVGGVSSFTADGDESGVYWKQNLFILQQRSPQPLLVPCERRVANRPEQYGVEYHGLIERTEAERVSANNALLVRQRAWLQMLRDAGEGAYLVRASKRSADAYTLCLLFDDNVLNYKLYYDGTHYVAEKRFESLEMLVADGLISMYVDKYAADYIKRMADEAIYEQSPYSQYHRRAANEYSPRSRPSPQPRAHAFAGVTFKIPQWCDFCRNLLWGLANQGVRCEHCGFAAHRKCSERAPNDCVPDSKYVKRMFAVDLTTLCLAHSVDVPPVLTKCIGELNKRGLDAEGIYRVSGSHEQIDRLRKQIDAAAASVDLAAVEDIHTVAGLLKLYLRLLPQQLVPYAVFRSLLAAYNSTRVTRERVLRCRQALNEMADANMLTLRALMAHLRLVVEHSNANRMTAENVCTIFSPTLFSTGGIAPSLPTQQHALLHLLLSNPQLLSSSTHMYSR